MTNKLYETLFAALALMTAGGCMMDVEDEELVPEALGEAALASVDPSYIPCSAGAHPTSPAGNLVVKRDTSDAITSSTQTACAVLGLAYVDASNNAFEVVSDPGLVAYAAGPVTCDVCLTYEAKVTGSGPVLGGGSGGIGGFGSGGSGGSPGPIPPSSGSGSLPKKGSSLAAGLGSRVAYPTDVASVGSLGSAPVNWHWGGEAPAYNSPLVTSFCDYTPTSTDWGPLTNPFGWERVPYGSGASFGGNAYQMYDPYTGFIRAASVNPYTGMLQIVPRTDTCE